MARTYHRDANGRFASGGGGGSSRPARKAAPTKAGNRLNRDNAGKITGIGKDGATARGGRIRTASGKRRATQTARMGRAGGRILKDRATRSAARSESQRLRVAAAAAEKRGRRDFNAGGTVVADKMRARAQRLDRMSAAERSREAAVAADKKKRAKSLPATGQARKDANRLRTLNNRLKFYEKEGYTPDEPKMVALASARNRLASSMIARGGQRVLVRSKSEAVRQQRGRRNELLNYTNLSIKGSRKSTGVRGSGKRIKAREVGTQFGLFGDKAIKSYRPTTRAPRRKGAAR